MFNEEQLNEFINRMFDNATNANLSVKEGLSNFRKYLCETKMCEESYLKKLDKIIECTPELLVLKRKLGNIDVMSLIPDEETSIKSSQKSLRKNKSNRTTNVCGGSSSSYSSSCSNSSSSYSNSCGGGSSYTRRC